MAKRIYESRSNSFLLTEILREKKGVLAAQEILLIQDICKMAQIYEF